MNVYGDMKFPEKLRKLIAHRRLSQSVLAEKLDVHQTQVSKWVRGKNTPDIDQGIIIARTLGVPLDYLADEHDERTIVEVDQEMKARDAIGVIGWTQAYTRILGQPSTGREPRLLPPPPRGKEESA